MSRFTSDTIERVRDSADIVEIVSAYTDLRRAGDRYTGLCPFHDERTPSFSVDVREKLYYCFGCGEGGDVFRFVQEKEGLRFADAVESLADRYGVEVERESEDPRAEQARRRRARLGEALERAAGFYAAFLWEAAEAGRAREYLAGRGLGEEVLREFGVGYAPSAWDTLLKRGQQAGFKPDELAAAGLLQRNRQGSVYDRFRARIMFPVRDSRGRMQGFGARALRPDQKPKYLNSPESELYRKSTTLYGIERSRGAIAKRGRAVVVEGYTDVLAGHQAGIAEAVAVMGTAITPEQLRLLAAHCEEVVLAMDADAAGAEAMLRAQRVARGKRLRLRVAAMPQGQDPADLLASEAGGAGAGGGAGQEGAGGSATGGAAAQGAKRAGPGAFGELIADAVALPEFHVRTLLDGADLDSPAGRDRALDEVVPVLAAMGDSISRDELVRTVADRLRADPALVRRRLAEGERGRPAGAAAVPTARPAAPGAGGAGGADGASGVERALSGSDRRERALLAMCVAEPVAGREFLGRLTAEHLSSPVAERARLWLTEHLEAPMAGLPRDDEELIALVTHVVMAAGREPASRPAMELNLLQLEQAMVERRIDAAGRAGGDPPVELQRRRAELAERIAHHEAGG